MSRRFATILPLLALAASACSPAQDGADQDQAPPPPQPVLTSQPAPTTAEDGTPLAPGSWAVEENADGASAVFSDPDGQKLAILACNRNARRLVLTKAEQASGPKAFRLSVGDLQARVDMVPVTDPLPGYSAEVDGSLPLFAAMADPAESIRLGAPGGMELHLPTHPGMSRVLEACR